MRNAVRKYLESEDVYYNVEHISPLGNPGMYVRTRVGPRYSFTTDLLGCFTQEQGTEAFMKGLWEARYRLSPRTFVFAVHGDLL
jgi:hypothetical protein